MMAIAALASAAIGTVTGGGLPLAGQKAGQLAAGTGRRQRAARTAGAAPRRPGVQEVLIPGPAGGSGGSRTMGGSGE
jgi:hypothetical protein